jgi:hypothetical protein
MEEEKAWRDDQETTKTAQPAEEVRDGLGEDCGTRKLGRIVSSTFDLRR